MTDFAPVAWQPASAPALAGTLRENEDLARAELWPMDHAGPEDVIVDDDGTAYAGTSDGSIVRLDGPGRATVLAEAGGRPLGLEWYGDDIIVCNADRGLQVISPDGIVSSMASGDDEGPFRYTNNATVASDGSIFFTDSSTRWSFDDSITALLEGRGTGRLLKRAPDGSISVVCRDLHFANGVTLDADESSVFVAETGRYRIRRHWLSGDRADTTEVFLDNLPGFPDNLTIANDTLWVSFVSPRQTMVDMMMPRPWLRSIIHRLPEGLKPKPVRHGFVVGYDTDGSVVHNLQDSSGRVAATTTAREHDGRLFIGSLSEPHIAVVEL